MGYVLANFYSISKLSLMAMSEDFNANFLNQMIKESQDCTYCFVL